MIQFSVPCTPVPQPRQRTRAFVDGLGRAVAHNYTPAKHPANMFKASVKLAFTEAYDGPMLEGPVGLRIWFRNPRPKSMAKKGLNPSVPDARKKGDLDNLCKTVMDSLNGLAWHDDCQVAELRATKWIVAIGEPACAEIHIWGL